MPMSEIIWRPVSASIVIDVRAKAVGVKSEANMMLLQSLKRLCAAAFATITAEGLFDAEAIINLKPRWDKVFDRAPLIIIA